ncbi:hypothetical protein HDF26_002790 [Pedobacter cryoconitis]|nr:hypothetical protein [Pedobacter cryoconitis]
MSSKEAGSFNVSRLFSFNNYPFNAFNSSKAAFSEEPGF